jgi:hypothetical protein
MKVQYPFEDSDSTIRPSHLLRIISGYGYEAVTLYKDIVIIRRTVTTHSIK